MRGPSVTSRSPCRAAAATTGPTFTRLSSFPRRSCGGRTCESREVDVRETLPDVVHQVLEKNVGLLLARRKVKESGRSGCTRVTCVSCVARRADEFGVLRSEPQGHTASAFFVVVRCSLLSTREPVATPTCMGIVRDLKCTLRCPAPPKTAMVRRDVRFPRRGEVGRAFVRRHGGGFDRTQRSPSPDGTNLTSTPSLRQHVSSFIPDGALVATHVS